MTRDEFYKLTDILNSEVLGNFMHGGEADELIAMFEEAVEHSNILEQEEPVIEDYKIYGSVAAVKALDRKRLCPQLKGNALHKFKNEFNTIKQIVHLLYDYDNPFCYRVALHWASWGAYNLKSFGNINEKEKAKMDISEEPVSDDLEEAAMSYGKSIVQLACDELSREFGGEYTPGEDNILC